MMEARSPGLYVHVPFCVSKCSYCDFYSVVGCKAASAWLKAISAEAKIYRDEFPPFETLYIGGGTPTVLGIKELERLFEIVMGEFSFEARFEFTVEANPDDLNREKLIALKEFGVNRLSIGAQSFDNGELALLGRRHDAATALGAIEKARSVGFDNIGIDLICAIPGQTIERMRANLESALSLCPEHLSCYELTLEPSSPLSRAIDSGDLVALREDDRRDLFVMISETLVGRGYMHYEVSNYAIDEEHRSRHNSKYWDHSPYLGLGPSAHSFSSSKRWWNVDDVDVYCCMLEEGNASIAGSEILSESQLLLERLYFGFRTSNGFERDFFDSLPGGAEILAELERTSLVRIEKSRVVPTLQGYLLSDRLPLLFSAD
jgi:oxygen-independent coproporphyrinogen-3 oxidase